MISAQIPPAGAGYAGQCQCGAGNIARFIGGIAKADGGHDQQHGRRADQGLTEGTAHRLGEAAAGDQAQARRHFLQHNGGENREQQRPQQGEAKTGSRGACRGDRTRADERGGNQYPGAHCPENSHTAPSV